MPETSNAVIEAKVLSRTVEELYATTPTGSLFMIAAVPFVLLLAWGRLPVIAVLYWGALGTAAFAIRMGLLWWFHTRRASHSDFFWRSWFQAGFFLSGLVWVALPWMVMGQTDPLTASLLSGLLAVVPMVSVFGVLFDLPTSMIQPMMIYPGIPADAVHKAFEPFSSLSGAGQNRDIQGAGLGLAISKSLAELHGGALTLETAPGAGVKAVLTLPAYRVVQEPANILPLVARSA